MNGDGLLRSVWDLEYFLTTDNQAQTTTWQPGGPVYYVQPLDSGGKPEGGQIMVWHKASEPAGLKVGDVVTINQWNASRRLAASFMARVIAVRRNGRVVGVIPAWGSLPCRISASVPHG